MEGQIDAVLSALCSQCNATRGAAEAQLKQWEEDPRLVVSLLARVDAASYNPINEPIQTLSCVLLSWRLPPLWGRLSRTERGQIQARILEQIHAHFAGPVLRTLAELAQVVAQASASEGEDWPELLEVRVRGVGFRNFCGWAGVFQETSRVGKGGARESPLCLGSHPYSSSP